MTNQTLDIGVNLNSVVRGQPVAIFRRGFDAYAMRGKLVLHGTDGTRAEGAIVASEVGRFYGLCQRFIGQNIFAGPAAAATPGYYAPDAALFDGIEAADTDARALHPMEPYTVLLVILTHSYVSTAAMSQAASG
ncbi:hypothetical protein [Methylobacterium sp. JK268]